MLLVILFTLSCVAGCVRISSTNGQVLNDNAPSTCLQLCKTDNIALHGQECHCFQQSPMYTGLAFIADSLQPCPGDASMNCGCHAVNNISIGLSVYEKVTQEELEEFKKLGLDDENSTGCMTVEYISGQPLVAMETCSSPLASFCKTSYPTRSSCKTEAVGSTWRLACLQTLGSIYMPVYAEQDLNRCWSEVKLRINGQKYWIGIVRIEQKATDTISSIVLQTSFSTISSLLSTITNDRSTLVVADKEDYNSAVTLESDLTFSSLVYSTFDSLSQTSSGEDEKTAAFPEVYPYSWFLTNERSDVSLTSFSTSSTSQVSQTSIIGASTVSVPNPSYHKPFSGITPTALLLSLSSHIYSSIKAIPSSESFETDTSLASTKQSLQETPLKLPNTSTVQLKPTAMLRFDGVASSDDNTLKSSAKSSRFVSTTATFYSPTTTTVPMFPRPFSKHSGSSSHYKISKAGHTKKQLPPQKASNTGKNYKSFKENYMDTSTLMVSTATTSDTKVATKGFSEAQGSDDTDLKLYVIGGCGAVVAVACLLSGCLVCYIVRSKREIRKILAILKDGGGDPRPRGALYADDNSKKKNSDDIHTDLDLRLFSIPRPSIKRSTSGVREIRAFRNVLRHNTKPYAAKPFNDGDVIRNHPNSRRQFSITQATPQSGRITQTNDRNSLPGDFHWRTSYNLGHDGTSMTSYTENDSISSVSSETSAPLPRRLSKRNMALPNVYCTIDTG